MSRRRQRNSLVRPNWHFALLATTIVAVADSAAAATSRSSPTGPAAAPAEAAIAKPTVDVPAADGRTRVAADGRSLERHEDGDWRPFFYLADTAWTAVTRLTEDEMRDYLDDRAGKSFTVIQTILVPWDARWSGNMHGDFPFIEHDETRPNEAYWLHVDRWLDLIAERGMVPAVVPFWLRGRNEDRGPTEQDLPAMRAYARFLGARLRNRELIWLLGADAPGDAWQQVIAAFAEELRRSAGRREPAPDADGLAQPDKTERTSHTPTPTRDEALPSSEVHTAQRARWLMTHHPEGGGTSARLFHNANWLDFNGLQSGHWLAGHHDTLIVQAWNREPAKPVIDLEPAYEHITNALVPVAPGVRLVDDWDVRRQAYQAVFAGAAGHAYGCAEVYEFHTDERGKARWTVGTHWREAMQFPGAGHLVHMRKLMEQLPMHGRVPDQSLVGGPPSDIVEYRRRAIRNAVGDCIYVYLPRGGTVRFDAGTLPDRPDDAPGEWTACWFEPRTGRSTPAEQASGKDGHLIYHSPTDGHPNDWVLILRQHGD